MSADMGLDGATVGLHATKGRSKGDPTLSVLSGLQRDAIRELVTENQWSWDKVAQEVGVETALLRWYVNDWPPDSARRAVMLRGCGARVARFLDNYIAPEKPKPEPSRKPTKRNDVWPHSLGHREKVK